MRLLINNPDLGQIYFNVTEVGPDWIGGYEEDEFQTYGELYADDDFNTMEIIS